MLNEQWLWHAPEYAHWGWIIALYLFLGGVGGGAYVTAAVAEILGKKYEGIAKAGAYLSPAVLIFGSVLLLFDLGDPIRGILVPITFVNPTSWMAIGAWLLLILIILGVIYAAAWQKGASRSIRLILAIIGAPIGIAVGAYTGFLISVVEFVPFWYTDLIPLLFTISAMSTGLAGACLLALSPRFGVVSPELEEGTSLFSKLDALLIIAEIVVIAVFIQTVSAIGGAASISVNLVTAGKYAIAFWGGVILLGLLIPLAFTAVSLVKRSLEAKHLTYEFGLVLFGGLVLRFVILYGAVKQPIVIP
jgi:formate-dependent nitrite reductase membrane component NrfD